MSEARVIRCRRGVRAVLAAGLVVLVATLVPTAALADAGDANSVGKAAVTSSARTSAGDQYGEESIPTTVEKGKSAAAGATASNPTPKPFEPPTSPTLPLTGLGLGAAALIGGTLLLLGVFLRRRDSRR